MPLTLYSPTITGWPSSIPTKPVIVSGTVIQLQMVNPHARLLVDEVLENGEIFHWNFEMAAASMLMRQGIRRDTLETWR